MARKRVRVQMERELGRRPSLAEGGLAEARARVKAARLSEVQTLCLAMLWYHDMNQEELSHRLRISQQAVSGHVGRGLERLLAAGPEAVREASNAPGPADLAGPTVPRGGQGRLVRAAARRKRCCLAPWA
ncbi:MAG: hypothetical protein NT031_08935 [Planctomycetota bacterium]|nr:hypothetical protein [Planctomycetota bacterium]